MYASHFNWLQVSFRRTSLSSTGFESRKGERFPRAQGRRYLPVSASILLYFESLILNPTLRAGSEREIDAAFATIAQQGGAALLVGVDPSFLARRDQIVALAARHAIPALYPVRDFAVA